MKYEIKLSELTNKRIRQCAGILSAVMVYYIIHEGAHLVYALAKGVFKQVNFMGVVVFWKIVLPTYQKSFAENGQ